MDVTAVVCWWIKNSIYNTDCWLPNKCHDADDHEPCEVQWDDCYDSMSGDRRFRRVTTITFDLQWVWVIKSSLLWLTSVLLSLLKQAKVLLKVLPRYHQLSMLSQGPNSAVKRTIMLTSATPKYKVKKSWTGNWVVLLSTLTSDGTN